MGRYRFWRDLGLVAGAVTAGLAADALGQGAAIAIVATLTCASGAIVAATRFGAEPIPAPVIGMGDARYLESRLDR